MCQNRRAHRPSGAKLAPSGVFHIIAEIASRYLAKGARVYVEGRLQARTWEGQDGQRRTAIEVVAGDFIMLAATRSPEMGTDAQGWEAGDGQLADPDNLMSEVGRNSPPLR